MMSFGTHGSCYEGFTDSDMLFALHCISLMCQCPRWRWLFVTLALPPPTRYSSFAVNVTYRQLGSGAIFLEHSVLFRQYAPLVVAMVVGDE